MQHGFSLLGVVVSIGVLLTGVLATAQLMARTENTVGLSRERLVAINLAREGLELVQARRDSNWGELINPNRDPILNVQSWVSEICEEDVGLRADPYRFVIESREERPAPDGEYELAIDTDGDRQLFVTDEGLYNHQGVGEESIYSREITTECIDANDDQTDGIETITVSSVVQWQRRGAPHEVRIKTRLYDWERH